MFTELYNTWKGEHYVKLMGKNSYKERFLTQWEVLLIPSRIVLCSCIKNIVIHNTSKLAIPHITQTFPKSLCFKSVAVNVENNLSPMCIAELLSERTVPYRGDLD